MGMKHLPLRFLSFGISGHVTSPISAPVGIWNPKPLEWQSSTPTTAHSHTYEKKGENTNSTGMVRMSGEGLLTYTIKTLPNCSWSLYPLCPIHALSSLTNKPMRS